MSAQDQLKAALTGTGPDAVVQIGRDGTDWAKSAETLTQISLDLLQLAKSAREISPDLGETSAAAIEKSSASMAQRADELRLGSQAFDLARLRLQSAINAQAGMTALGDEPEPFRYDPTNPASLADQQTQHHNDSTAYWGDYHANEAKAQHALDQLDTGYTEAGDMFATIHGEKDRPEPPPNALKFNPDGFGDGSEGRRGTHVGYVGVRHWIEEVPKNPGPPHPPIVCPPPPPPPTTIEPVIPVCPPPEPTPTPTPTPTPEPPPTGGPGTPQGPTVPTGPGGAGPGVPGAGATPGGSSAGPLGGALGSGAAIGAGAIGSAAAIRGGALPPAGIAGSSARGSSARAIGSSTRSAGAGGTLSRAGSGTGSGARAGAGVAGSRGSGARGGSARGGTGAGARTGGTAGARGNRKGDAQSRDRDAMLLDEDWLDDDATGPDVLQ